MKEKLRAQFLTIQAIRNFFNQEGFLDVMTPPAVRNPGMEAHLHPLRLKSTVENVDRDYYLHTSPEFHMKELLSLGFEKIFNISYCFRDEPSSDHHRFQFMMLEWYRANQHYTKIMDDTENLLSYSYEFLKDQNVKVRPDLMNAPFERVTVDSLFQEYLDFSILDFLDKKELSKKIIADVKEVPLPRAESELEKLSWDDLFFLLFLNKIEPEFTKRPKLLVYEYPHHLSALSTIKANDPRVCERFEVYLDGIELCNCFNELCDLDIQKKRFQREAEIKKELYGYSLPEATVLYNALERGLPTSTGIALGVERLLLGLTGIDNPFYY